jgi:hypothetical protein
MMRALHRPLAVVALATLGGCADLACTPTTIVVAEVDERPRLRSEPTGLRTDELGRVKAQRRDVVVSEYWVRDQAGRWYRVDAEAWRTAQPGRSLVVCR